MTDFLHFRDTFTSCGENILAMVSRKINLTRQWALMVLEKVI